MTLYMKYLAIHLKSQMQYKVSFTLNAVGQFLIAFSVFISVFFMFSRFGSVADFTYNQVLLCFAIVLMAFAISECFFRGFDTFPSTISNGEFDRIMVRPRGIVFQVLASKIDLSRIGRLVQAVVVLIYAIPTSGVVWSPLKVITLVLMLLGGIAVFSSLFVVYAALCFFTIEGLEFMNILTDGGREFGTYPLSIYGKEILKFFTFVVPLALFQYFPLLYLLGRTDNLLYMFAPLFSLLFSLPAYLLWRLGVKRYTSTGS